MAGFFQVLNDKHAHCKCFLSEPQVKSQTSSLDRDVLQSSLFREMLVVEYIVETRTFHFSN